MMKKKVAVAELEITKNQSMLLVQTEKVTARRYNVKRTSSDTCYSQQHSLLHLSLQLAAVR